MRGDRIRQALQIVAAFEQRDDAAAGVTVGDLHQLAGDPGEIRLEQIEIGERIADVRVEAGRDQDEVRRESHRSRGRIDGFERLAEAARRRRRRAAAR